MGADSRLESIDIEKIVGADEASHMKGESGEIRIFPTDRFPIDPGEIRPGSTWSGECGEVDDLAGEER